MIGVTAAVGGLRRAERRTRRPTRRRRVAALREAEQTRPRAGRHRGLRRRRPAERAALLGSIAAARATHLEALK